MSALAAVVLRDGSPVSAHRLSSVAAALESFGRGAPVASVREGPAGLACVDSMPFEPGGSGQRCTSPVVRLAGQRTLLFAGFLHHRTDLETALGLGATGLTDAELFARAWERWEDDALLNAHGEFAVVVWDVSARRLTAACSPLTAPPLCYSINRRRALLATVPRLIFAWGDLSPRLADEPLASSLILDYGDGRSTFYEDVRWLLPGEALSVTPEATRVRTYYDLRERVKTVGGTASSRPRISTADCLEGTLQLLRNAVKSSLRASRTPAVLMSGGLDSTTVAVTALELLADEPAAGPLASFTSVPEPGWDGHPAEGNERARVQLLAEQHPVLNARFVNAAGAGYGHFLEPTFEVGQIVPRNVGNLCWMHECHRLAGVDGRTVMLTGESGNATLTNAGVLRLAALLTRGRLVTLLRTASGLPTGRLGRASPLVRHALLPLLRSWSRGRMGTWAHRWCPYSAIHPEFAHAMGVDERARQDHWRRPIRCRTARLDSQLRMMANPGKRSFGRALNLAFQVLHGTQVRDPLGERRFVEWCLSLPDDQYLERGRDRLLARRLMRGRLPAEILNFRGRGVQAADWHVRATRDMPATRRYLQAWRRDPAVAGRLDLPRLMRLVDTWPSHAPRGTHDYREYMLARAGLERAMATGRFIRWVERGTA